MLQTAAIPQGNVPPVNESRATLGDYELLHEIASGGMATVYLARKRGVGGFERLVAIKCCHPHLRRDPAFVTMFLDEARLAARIHHPNVVGTLEVSDGDALYFVMQYVEGMSLAEWIGLLLPRNERIAEPLLLRVVIDALAGLHAAHELRDHDGQSFRLVHRDVSPQNLLIGLDGVTRIADFGIAKAESRATRTRTGQVKGKTGYMPPEQILGEPLDRRADVYAAGVVLWEALVGRRLFDSESDAATINQVLNGAIPAPSEAADVSKVLDPIVMRALQFEPEARYATAVEFAQALQASGLPVVNHGAVGDAIRDFCNEQVLRLRNAAMRRSSVELAPAPSVASPAFALPGGEPARARVIWLAAGLLGISLLMVSLWLLRSRAATKIPQASVAQPSAIVPVSQPSAVGPVSPATAATTPSQIVESPSRRPAKATHQKSPPVVATHPSVNVTPHANTEAPVPPTPNLTPSARPRAKPSEFRPPDL